MSYLSSCVQIRIYIKDGNKYETAQYFFIKPELDMGLFVDFCVFT